MLGEGGRSDSARGGRVVRSEPAREHVMELISTYPTDPEPAASERAGEPGPFRLDSDGQSRRTSEYAGSSVKTSGPTSPSAGGGAGPNRAALPGADLSDDKLPSVSASFLTSCEI